MNAILFHFFLFFQPPWNLPLSIFSVFTKLKMPKISSFSSSRFTNDVNFLLVSLSVFLCWFRCVLFWNYIVSMLRFCLWNILFNFFFFLSLTFSLSLRLLYVAIRSTLAYFFFFLSFISSSVVVHRIVVFLAFVPVDLWKKRRNKTEA